MKKSQGIGVIKALGIVILIIAVTVGITYAYFTLQITGTPSDITLNSGQFDLNFINSKYISVINGNLIDNENKSTDASISLFSMGLTSGSSVNNIEYYVQLDEVAMSETLYTKYFHYELVKFNVVQDTVSTNQSSCMNAEGIRFWETDENKCYKLASQTPESTLSSNHFGFCDSSDLTNYNSSACNDFKSSNKLKLNVNSIALTNPEKHFLGVRVWIENDKTANSSTNNQNHLMDNEFSSKISIVARQV